MNAIRTMGLVVLSCAGVVAFPPHTPVRRDVGRWRHTRLIKSYPVDHDTLTKSPAALRLWFSEQVELPVTTVKLADAAGVLVPLALVARPDTGQDAPVVAALTTSLAAGAYVVAWSTAAKDGHPAKGTFGFVVKATR